MADQQARKAELIDRVAAAIYEGTTHNLVAEWEDIVNFESDDVTEGMTEGMTASEYRFMAEEIVDVVLEFASPVAKPPYGATIYERFLVSETEIE